MSGFNSSVVSYPGRGPYGTSSYRGNTSGRIVREFLETYHPLRRYVQDSAQMPQISGQRVFLSRKFP